MKNNVVDFSILSRFFYFWSLRTTLSFCI